MAGTSDKEYVNVATFPRGVNNRAPLKHPERDQDGNVLSACELVNVDLDGAGKPRRMRGHVVEVATAAHSLHATDTHLLALVAGDLRAYSAAGGTLTDAGAIVAGLGDRFVTYASDDRSTWYSNGQAIGRLDAALGAHPVWPGTPDPVTLAATAAGALAAGNYEVSVTVLDDDGRESGASAPVVIALTAGQGIAVTLPAVPVDAVTWRVYVSHANGEVLYRALELPIATATAQIGAGRRGAALETEWLHPFPPCLTLRYGHNRMLGLTGALLVWSEPYRLGLVADTNYLTIGAGGTLLEPVGEGSEAAGWFVADHKTTYWMAGADPMQWRQVRRYPHAAVPGTSLVVSGAVFGLEDPAPVALWVASNGVFCLGLPGGVVRPLREDALALPVDAERGAAAFFDFNAVRQIVTSLLAGSANAGAVSDSAEATVRRNGVTT